MKDLSIQEWFTQESNQMKAFITWWKSQQDVYGKEEYPDLLDFKHWNREYFINKGLLNIISED